MKQMKKLLASLLASALLLTGCTGGTSSEGSSAASGEESSTVSQAPLTDEDILAEAEPYLEDTVWQNPSAYAGMDEFLSANLALDSTQVAAVTIYMGAPNQNTSFFLMLTPHGGGRPRSDPGEAGKQGGRHGEYRRDGLYPGLCGL